MPYLLVSKLFYPTAQIPCTFLVSRCFGKIFLLGYEKFPHRAQVLTYETDN